jgi:fluoroquinolone resistance protein
VELSESRQNHIRVTFKDAELPGVRIASSDFDTCTFERCILTEAVLSHCRFTSCKFIACDLSLLCAPNCRFVDVEFIESKLAGVDWTVVGSTKTDRQLFSAAFDRCALDYSSFFGLRLKKLSSCSALEVDFSEADLTGANCQRSDFAGAKFLHTNLSGANFVGARGYAIDLSANRAKKAKFSYPEAMSLLSAFDVIVEY